jgi:hypothetical protein
MTYRAAFVQTTCPFPLPIEVALARVLGSKTTSCGLWPGADRVNS